MANFKWGKGEHDRFFNKINRYNKKLKEAENNGYMFDLPPQLNYKTELNKILSTKNYSREQFNKETKFMDSFLKKDSLEVKKATRGAKIPMWEYRDIKNEKIKEINKVRMAQKAILQDQNATDRGKDLKVKAKDVEDLKTNKIRKKEFNWKNMGWTDFEFFKRTLAEYGISLDHKNKMMYENYITSLHNNLNENDAKKIEKIIRKMPVETVINRIYNDINLDFEFNYLKLEYETKLDILNKGWGKINKDYQNTLKG